MLLHWRQRRRRRRRRVDRHIIGIWDTGGRWTCSSITVIGNAPQSSDWIDARKNLVFNFALTSVASIARPAVDPVKDLCRHLINIVAFISRCGWDERIKGLVVGWRRWRQGQLVCRICCGGDGALGQLLFGAVTRRWCFLHLDGNINICCLHKRDSTDERLELRLVMILDRLSTSTSSP